MAAFAPAPRPPRRSQKNVVTGEGHIDKIAQNGIVDQERRDRHGEEQHRQRLPLHTDDHRSLWPAALDEAGSVTASGNKFADNEVNIYRRERHARRPRQALTSDRPRHRPGSPRGGPGLLIPPVVSARSCAIRRTPRPPRPLPEPCSRSRMRLPPLVDGRRGGVAHHSMQTRQACLRRPPSVSAPDRERSREGGPAPLARTSRRRVPLGGPAAGLWQPVPVEFAWFDRCPGRMKGAEFEAD